VKRSFLEAFRGGYPPLGIKIKLKKGYTKKREMESKP
jgi:hypothetical protein